LLMLHQFRLSVQFFFNKRPVLDDRLILLKHLNFSPLFVSLLRLLRLSRFLKRSLTLIGFEFLLGIWNIIRLLCKFLKWLRPWFFDSLHTGFVVLERSRRRLLLRLLNRCMSAFWNVLWRGVLILLLSDEFLKKLRVLHVRHSW
jgi:hypothetical protein